MFCLNKDEATEPQLLWVNGSYFSYFDLNLSKRHQWAKIYWELEASYPKELVLRAQVRRFVLLSFIPED